MDQNEESKSKGKGGPRANVRFSDQEYQQLSRDELTRGISIPLLLKEAYFEGRPTAVLMTKEDAKAILLELLRQGNNINQLARQANAGIIKGVTDELNRIGRALEGMQASLRIKAQRLKAAT